MVAIVVPLVFLAGFVDAIAGGGGLISLPAFLIAGLPPHQAIGTNKICGAIGTTVSTARYIKRGYVIWRLAIPSAVLAILGASLGSKLILAIDERIIRYFLLGVLPIVAVVVLRERDLGARAQREIEPHKQTAIVLAASFFVGIYDGFYGPGTGTFLLLIFTQLAGLSIENASGGVKVANLSSNIGSVIVFLLNGKPMVLLGLIAGVSCLLGHYIGSGMVIKNGAKIVRPIVLVVLALLFVRVIYELMG